MKYPIAIEEGSETTAFGVVVPDLPGCFPPAIRWTRRSKTAGRQSPCGSRRPLMPERPYPHRGRIADHVHNPEYAGMVWAIVDIDSALLDDKTERINISVPRRVLSRIDRYVSARGETRSGFLVNAALERIAHGCR